MTPQDFVPTSFVTRDGSVRVFRDDEHLWHAVAVGEVERPLLDAPRLTSWCAMVDALDALGALDDEEPHDDPGPDPDERPPCVYDMPW